MSFTALIVVPCHNEESVLAANVERLHRFCVDHLAGCDWSIVIADNHSTDSTADIGRTLASQYQHVQYTFLDRKGRGNALRTCWLNGATVDVYAYMDADLATHLNHIPALLGSVAGGADIAVGTRLVPGAQVIGRSASREVSSRGYNLCLKLVFGARFHDAQCGFKAISRRAREEIVPLSRDGHWFFDSEILTLAQKKGWPIVEIPVTWEEHQVRDTKVKLLSDILYFLRRMAGLRLRLWFDRGLRRRLQKISLE